MTTSSRANTLSTSMPGVHPVLLRLRDTLVKNVLPPVVVMAILIGLWEALCSYPGAALPPPSQVLNDTWELIIHPFYD